jgi:uncharacterized protein YegP (UPF0339 family)
VSSKSAHPASAESGDDWEVDGQCSPLYPWQHSSGYRVQQIKGDGMTEKFELFKDHAGKFRFHLKAANGEIIASSQGYNSKAAAENGIKSVRTNAPDAALVDQTD